MLTTKYLIDNLKVKGVKIGYVTLHIGLGTFRPIMVEDLTRHHMDSESFSVPKDTADLINREGHQTSLKYFKDLFHASGYIPNSHAQ